ncbi:MAG TPA: hypothetical protein PL065_21375, partial [Polyangiaceae bacterium]|nr:hypothetical protein [Polyangiaceae bacterium]
MKRSFFFLWLTASWAMGWMGCGDSDSADSNSSTPTESDAGSDVVSEGSTGTDALSDGGSDDTASEAAMEGSTPLGSVITTVNLHNPTEKEAIDVPLTFGHVFRPGDVPKGTTLQARVGETLIPTQVDSKARHADGSLRHAIVTVVASIPASGAVQAELLTIPLPEAQTAVELGDLLNTDFNASLTLTVDAKTYSLDAKTLLQGKIDRTWLSGPIVSEWIVAGPVVSGQSYHPHLSARFSVRAYTGLKSVRVGLSVDNDWAFEPEPRNFVYDASVQMGSKQVFSLSNLTHHRQARWRKVFWWGDEVQAYVTHDSRYLMNSGALPHYDPELTISDEGLEKQYAKWGTLNTGPMGIGPMEPYMPTTGAHDDIGPLSRWDALFLCSMDRRAQEMAMGLADLAGSWPIHYRDKDTGMPVRLDDYPYMSLLGNPGDKVNPKTGKSEAFPACASQADCKSPYTPDSAHQPSMGYLAYVVGGDYDHLEELMFWANYNMLESNPHYRAFEQGLLKWGQVRGQAWSLRTLGFAAYIVPDDHSFKAYFNERLDYNLQYYLDR